MNERDFKAIIESYSNSGDKQNQEKKNKFVYFPNTPNFQMSIYILH